MEIKTRQLLPFTRRKHPLIGIGSTKEWNSSKLRPPGWPVGISASTLSPSPHYQEGTPDPRHLPATGTAVDASYLLRGCLLQITPAAFWSLERSFF